MRDLLFKDFGWKLFSLLLAAFIWYTVEKIVEEPKAAVISPANVQAQFYEVPVLVVAAVGADRAPSQVNSNTVSVTVSGPPAVMNILQPNHKSRGASRRVDVSVPWGVTVIDVEPAQLTIVPQAHP